MWLPDGEQQPVFRSDLRIIRFAQAPTNFSCGSEKNRRNSTFRTVLWEYNPQLAIHGHINVHSCLCHRFLSLVDESAPRSASTDLQEMGRDAGNRIGSFHVSEHPF